MRYPTKVRPITVENKFVNNVTYDHLLALE